MAIQNFEIVNNDRNVSETIPLKAIVSAPVERFKYTRYQKNNEVNIAYVESKEITSLDNLSILERHWEKPENNTSLLEDFEFLNINNQKVFYSEYKRLLVTDKVYVDKHGENRPLFYKHKTKATPASEIVFYYIQNGTRYSDLEGYKVSESNGELYTNYQNYFDYETGSYRVFFVSYSDASGKSYEEILNPEPAIVEISEDCIDPDTGKIIKDCYTVEQTEGRYKFEIILESSLSSRQCDSEDGFYIKPLEVNEIKLIKPESIYLDNPWYLRISNGEFVSNGMRYYIPEYYYQEFSNEFGSIRLEDKDAYYVTEKLIKLPVERITYDTDENFNIDLIIMDEEENVLRAITSDVNKVNLRQFYQDTDVRYETGIIQSVDENKGFIELAESAINKTNIIKASFFYKTEELYYNLVDFNPINNKSLLDHRYVIYLKPDRQSLQRSIFYLKLNRENIIVETSDSDFKVNNPDGSFNERNIIGQELLTFETNNSDFLILGEISINEDSSPDELFVFDIERNSRVEENNLTLAVKNNFRILQSEFMYGEDGQKIQRNNIASIDVPYDLTFEYSDKDIKRFLNNKIPISTNYVVNYVYPKSNIELNVNDSLNIELKISWEGPYTYTIYRNKEVEGSFTAEEIVHTVDGSERPENDMMLYTDVINEDYKGVFYYNVKVENYPVGNTFGIKRDL